LATLPLPLIPYCVHFALSKALHFFMTTVYYQYTVVIKNSALLITVKLSALI